MKTLKKLAIVSVLFVAGWLVAGSLLVPDRPCEATWFSDTDERLLMQVRHDIRQAKEYGCDALVVELMSSGGPVTTSIEIAQEIRRAAPLIVEIHGRSWLASGGTIVFGAGTKGYRYIDRNAVVIVHGLQRGDWFGSSCVGLMDNPVTEAEKLNNAWVRQVAQDYALSTGQPPEVTLKWLMCGNEQVGSGALLVLLGLADRLE